ncbi:MAG: hypothetical protein JOZ18_14820 [Chloroflexi bacterium]|nr:hypothetical protein [Chloroflexota bacterium]
MKHLLKAALLVCVVALFLSALSLSTAGAKASSSFWKVYQGRYSLNAGTPTATFPGGHALNGVAAVSASDVWAVGNSLTKTFQSPKLLIEHWNGKQWSMVKSPNPGSFENSLNNVAVVTANDVWAVGEFSNSSSSSQTLFEHWNGKSWSVVKSPTPAGSTSIFLGGLAVVSASDIWAVGSSSNSSSSSQTLIEHWNGKDWSIVTSPNRGSQDSLGSIASVTANDIWAVGSSSNNSSSSQTLTEHWNGSTWSIVTSPSPGSGVVGLNGVTVVSTNNVWAVGTNNTNGTTLIEHWNGSSWSVVTSPNPGQINLLLGVAAVSGTDIWAVGQSLAANGNVLIAYWNGSTWSGATSPDAPGSVNNFLAGISVISATDIWAVGVYQSNNIAAHPLTEHWNGSTWSVVPSP